MPVSDLMARTDQNSFAGKETITALRERDLVKLDDAKDPEDLFAATPLVELKHMPISSQPA